MLVSGAVAQIPADNGTVPRAAALESTSLLPAGAERQGDKSWMKHISLKGFHRPQTLICLDILPQLVHRRGDTYMMVSFAINSNQCDTLKIKYAIFSNPDQKSLEVCGKNSSGFIKAESGSIIHESCIHNTWKKRPLFSILHCLNLDLYFICP